MPAAGVKVGARRAADTTTQADAPAHALHGSGRRLQSHRNAVRLTQKLLSQKLFAYHFIDESGFYKVRIGNFPTREEAIERAERLKAARVIDEYFIVAPGDYAAAKSDLTHEGLLRQEIVRTAERFIGVPYQWGGESSVSGFDC